MGKHQTVQDEHINEESEKKKSLGLFHGEVAAEAAGEAANAYAPASLLAAGAGGSAMVAMLSTLNNFVAAFLYIKVPTVVQRIGSRKKAVLMLAFLDAVGWLPLVAILLFFKEVDPLWLIPCWIFNLIPGMLLAPARSSWLADIVPANIRGRYFGTRAAISGAAYLGTFFIFGGVLEIFQKQQLIGFALLFLVAFAANIVCFLLYSRIHNTPVIPEKDTNFGFLDFLGETRQRNLGKFILFVAVFQFTVYISSPFFTPYMLSDLHLTYVFFALIFASEFLAKVLIVTFWGKYADRVGNLKVMKIVAFAIPFVPLLWLVSHNVVYLVAVQLFSGACWAGFDLCSGNFVYEAAPLGKRLKYIAYNKALTTAFMAGGALLGAYLLGVVRPVLGNNILTLFVLSGVLRLAVTLVMFPKLKEVRGTMRSHLSDPVMVTAVGPTVMHREALLHRPNKWARFGQLQPVAIPVPVEAKHIDSRGLFYRPREWPMFSKTQGPETSLSEIQSEAAPNSRGLLYRPKGWIQSNATEPTLAESHSDKLAGNWGLFYRRGEWSRFGRPQEAEIDTADPKRGLFHRIQEKVGSDKPTIAEKNTRRPGRLQPATVLAR